MLPLRLDGVVEGRREIRATMRRSPSSWPLEGQASSRVRCSSSKSTTSIRTRSVRLLIPWGGWGDDDTADAIRTAMALGHIDYYVLEPWSDPRRALPPARSPSSSRSGGRQNAPRPSRAHRRRRPAGRRGVRAAEPARAKRRPARVPRERLGARVRGSSRSCGQHGRDGAGRDPPGRRGARRPDGRGPRRSTRTRCRPSSTMDDWPLRRRDRRRRPGRPRRGGVRVVGGPARPRRRARVDRRAGGLEHAHPQLPRLLARPQRRRARAARVPAGLGVRRDVPPHARGDRRCARRGTRARRLDRWRSRGRGAERGPRDGCVVPARSTSPRSPSSRARRLLRLLAVRGEAVHGRRASSSSAAPTPAGQAAVHLARYAESVTILCRQRAREEHVAVPHRRDRGQGEHPRARSATRGRRRGGRRAGSSADAARPGRRSRTVPADALFILIGAEPRTEWLPTEIERDERGFVATGADYETSVPGVFAIGDVRAGSVKRVASAVGEGSVVIQHVHRHLEAAEARARAGGPLLAVGRRSRASPGGPSGARPWRRRPRSSERGREGRAIAESDAGDFEMLGRSAMPATPSVSWIDETSVSSVVDSVSSAVFTSSPPSVSGAEVLEVVDELSVVLRTSSAADSAPPSRGSTGR